MANHKRTETVLLHHWHCEGCNVNEVMPSLILATIGLYNHLKSHGTHKLTYVEEVPFVVEIRRHYEDEKRKDCDEVD